MKRVTIIAWCSSLVLLSYGCLPKPAKPNLAGYNQGGSGGNSEADKKPRIGQEIEKGQDADGYGANLRCEEPETFRGFRAWRRLSNIEVQNTVSDVFGVAGIDYSQFPADIPKKEIFDTMNIEVNFVGDARFAGYENFAKSLAAKVDVNRYFPCLASGTMCMSSSLPAFIANAWRRPATPNDITNLMALFADLTKDGLNNEAAARVVIQAVVLSHNFLYRSELGTLQDDGSFILTDWELASALSYTIWRRPPNEDIKKMAEAGDLSKDGVIRTLATKMMNDPLAKAAWKDFSGQMMDVGKIETATKSQSPEFTALMKSQMVDEARNFIATIMFDSDKPTFKELMTANYTTADAALDPIYKAKSQAGKTVFTEPARRGLLGQAGFLTAHATESMSNPITRGAFVAERLLCLDFKGAPPTVAPAMKPGASTKSIFKEHSENAACASCHASIDAIGFSLENFDFMGRYRIMDAGQPIVVDGLLHIDNKKIPITSSQQLFESIANSNQAQECFVRQAFRYGFGRTEFFWRPVAAREDQPKLSSQGELDRCQIQSATEKVIAMGGDLKTAVIELVSSPAFRYRLKGKPEVVK